MSRFLRTLTVLTAAALALGCASAAPALAAARPTAHIAGAWDPLANLPGYTGGGPLEVAGRCRHANDVMVGIDRGHPDTVRCRHGRFHASFPLFAERGRHTAHAMPARMTSSGRWLYGRMASKRFRLRYRGN